MIVLVKSGKFEWLLRVKRREESSEFEVERTCNSGLPTWNVRKMLNDSFVQHYQSVAWQDDSAVMVHSSKFSRQ